MFCGDHAINMDAKGRIAIPVRQRERLADMCEGQVVITIDVDTSQKCLVIYPYPEWETIVHKINQLPSMHPATKQVRRLVLGHGHEVTMDSQGRLLVPPLLRQYAELEKRTILLGVGKKLEIWSESHWHTVRNELLEASLNRQTDFPEELSQLSL